MLKVKGRASNGDDLLFLGLTQENLTRMAAGAPIMFNLAQLGLPPAHVVLYAGTDTHDLVEQLRTAGLPMPPAAEFPEPTAQEHIRWPTFGDA